MNAEQIAQIVAQVIAATGSGTSPKVTKLPSLPSLDRTARVEIYKSVKRNTLSLHVVSATETEVLPNGTTRPCETWIGNLLNVDGTFKPVANRLLTASNLVKQGAFLQDMGEQLMAQFKAEVENAGK